MLTTGSGAVEAAERELCAAMDSRPRNAATCATPLERAIALARADEQAAGYFHLPELYDLLARSTSSLAGSTTPVTRRRSAALSGGKGNQSGGDAPSRREV